MIVAAKHRFLRPSVVTADATRCRVRKEGSDGYRIEGPNPSDVGRLVYRKWKGEATIERTEGIVSIRFQPQGTDFVWDRRTYHLGDMLDGDIRIREGERLVVEGRVTVSGVRLETRIPDLDPIARELAFVLALRSENVIRAAHAEWSNG